MRKENVGWMHRFCFKFECKAFDIGASNSFEKLVLVKVDEEKLGHGDVQIDGLSST